MSGEHNHPDLADDIADLTARVTALEAGTGTTPEPPTPTKDFAFAWWATSDVDEIGRHADAGYTHNVVWSNDPKLMNVVYLDRLEAAGIKCITVIRPELVDHPAIVGGIVADEPDIMLTPSATVPANTPKRTPELVATTAAAFRKMWPGITIYSTLGSPCAAGPLDNDTAESTPAGYWSIEAGGINSNPKMDIARYDAYSEPLDVAIPQMYTVAGRDKPLYRKAGAGNITPQQAGVRDSAFVAKGMARTRRLCPDVDLWALLAPCQFWAGGRDPSPQELQIEADAVAAAGGKGVLYFGYSMDPSVQHLIDRPVQLGYVADVIARIRG